ncbi:RDD family protein [Micromonospora soli]|uniref:RDD family protein n=1 Tax=Micromonospora sp. NBRC 110009 TaxID=3061627 RepID=UPI0026718297|nr:RDD family protein [Micromonospora sp. NBRC 110009]WKU01330.1 RDD family protein [Micromonospora sp. NBRC 110009]
MSVQPGWYVDPADPETRRYWDGEGWIGAPIPVDATPPEGPPSPEPAPAAAPAPTPHPGAPGGYLGQPGPGPAAGQPVGAPYRGQPGAGPYPGQPVGGPGQWPGHPPAPGQPPGPPPGWPYPSWPARPPLPRPHGLPLASYGARLVARLIDIFVLFLLNVAVNGWFVWRLLGELAPPLREAWRRAETPDATTAPLPPAGQQTDALWLAIVLIVAALWFAYEVPSMAARGQTFGKRVMGIRALPVEADQPLGFGRATRRWTTLGLPTLLWYCAGFGLLLQFMDAVSVLFDQPLRQALHDKRAQTVVVQLPRTRPDTRTTPRDRANPPGDTP